MPCIFSHSEDARTGHDHVQDASIYLGITVRERTDYCFLPNSDGYRKAAKLLKETLEEEKATDIKLTDLAINNVNKKAENKA